jgi:hypothetical protein
MTLGGAVLTSAVSGAIAGGIGASAASVEHPVLRGALVTGAVNALLTLIFTAGAESTKPLSPGVSGLPANWCGTRAELRFP